MITAIIVTYQTGRVLKDCLSALKGRDEISELIIIDNGNPPEMADWLRRFVAAAPRAQLIETGDNLGFGRAVNLGARAAQSDYLLVLNPDCVIRPDALAPLQVAANGRRSPTIMGGRIFGVDGRALRGPQRAELTLGRLLSKLLGGPGIDLPLEPQPVGPVPMPVISGAFFLIDRAGFESLGGFDEGYFLHVEDIDLCQRARKAGGEVMYQPAAGALHYGSTSQVSTVFVAKHKAAGFAHYLRTHMRKPIARLGAELLIPLIYVALIGRAWLSKEKA